MSAEAERAFGVTDGLVVVFDATAEVGALPGRAERLGLPRICFVNKLDAAGADFGRSLSEAARHTGADLLVCHLPVSRDGVFLGVVDLVTGQERSVAGHALDCGAEAARGRAQLCGALRLSDGASVEDMVAAVRAGTAEGRFVPVLCGSAYEGVGIDLLLDAVVSYLPPPRAAEKVSFAGLAFGSLDDSVAGALTFIRIYSGAVGSGARVLNASRHVEEEVGRVVRFRANHREEVEEARAGEIVALAGLRDSEAGDTLCDPARPVIIAAGELPAKVA